MSKRMLNMSVAALLAAGVVAAPSVGSATPLADAVMITKVQVIDTAVETVRWAGDSVGG
jgi:hypothetical protein